MIIETVNLTKLYNGRPGCQDICLSVAEGQVFGFLGPNGAGKSTVVKTLLGLISPTSGQAWVMGKPVGHREARQKIGFLPENFRFQEWLSGRELLEFHAALYGLGVRERRPRIDYVLELVNLRGREEERIKGYSKGMQQRIGLASALLADPTLVFLDEPTSALDPLGRKEVRDIIKNLNSEGKTVFLNSHLLSEVEMTCNEVAFIKKGRIVDSGPISEFLTGSLRVTLRFEGGAQIMEALSQIAEEIISVLGKVQATIKSEAQIPLLAAAVIENGGCLYELSPETVSLEDIFMEMMGECG